MLLVKLADRVHNMRTLHYLRDPEKRQRIARETMEIYAPLAERIGMQEMKDELEDLAFAELNPDARDSILARLVVPARAKAGWSAACLDELRHTLEEPDAKAGVTGREKTAYSIWRKMQRKNVGVRAASDIMAFRVMVDSVERVLSGAGHRSTRAIRWCPAASRTTSRRRSRTATVAPHRRDRPGAAADRGADPHQRHARGRGTRRRRPLGIQAATTSAPKAGSIAGCANCWTSWSMPQKPEEFLEHTKLEMFQDRCSASRPRAI